MAMKRLIPVLLTALLLGAVLLAGCGGDSSVADDAQKQIDSAKAELATANELGVQIPENDQKLIEQAESELAKDSVNALIHATTAKANIQNDVQDAFNVAQSTYNTAKGAAETAISKAPEGTDLTQARQSLAQGDEKASSAKTIDDWYNASSGAIYFANLAAQQATAAALAQASSSAAAQATAAEIQRVQQGIAQIEHLMANYIRSKGGNPADYKIGITKVSADSNWVTGSATPIAAAPGSQPISFLFQHENGTWVLRAAPSWTPGQFGSPADMLP
jgi:hypothetical protein